jgi:lipoprotein signal peptidase
MPAGRHESGIEHAQEAFPVPSPGQVRTLLGVIALTTIADQAAKWWAWRHLAHARINPGATGHPGYLLSQWYSGPVTGGLLDLLDSALLVIAAVALVRRRRRVVVLLSGAAMLGGWGSNLLDRLGLHTMTAPGSARGAVDFIHVGTWYINVADFAIVAGTAVFLIAAAAEAARRLTAGRTRFGASRLAASAAGVALVLVTALVGALTTGVAHGGAPVYRAVQAQHIR